MNPTVEQLHGQSSRNYTIILMKTMHTDVV